MVGVVGLGGRCGGAGTGRSGGGGDGAGDEFFTPPCSALLCAPAGVPEIGLTSYLHDFGPFQALMTHWFHLLPMITSSQQPTIFSHSLLALARITMQG